MNNKPAVVLINLGSPQRPTINATAKYLRAFLRDPFVLEMNGLLREVLVNFFIVPFRSPRTNSWYRRIWRPEGAPLTVYTEQLRALVAEKLEGKADVFHAFRYSNPSIAETMGNLRYEGYSNIVIVPLYPQFHSSTNRTAEYQAHLELRLWDEKPKVSLFRGFHQHPQFIRAWSERLREKNWEQFDHILFSYHGVPAKYQEYARDCIETSQLIAAHLNIPKEKYSIAFQSRFGKNWLKPGTDHTIKSLARTGTKSLLVVAPSFVADNLETLVELGETNKALFLKEGGHTFVCCESLNASPIWVECLASMIDEQL